MRRRALALKKKAWLGILFAVLITLGAATAAFTAGAAPFGAQATTTIVSTVTTGGSTAVTTITTTTPDSTSSSTGSTSTSTTTTTTPRKITICHHAHAKNGAVKHVTIKISRSAWKAHQRHGDSIGACSTAAAKKFHSRPAHVKKFHGKKKK
jgi:hypothetical protein